ncbi:hypothetical protein GCM10027610_065980 [Dactylosporangium cerinum]
MIALNSRWVERLGEAFGVTGGGHRAVGVGGEGEPLVLGDRAGRQRRLERELGEVDLDDVEPQAGLVQAGDEEQVVDEAQEPVGVALHDGQEAADRLRVVGGVVLVQQHLDVAAHRRQRRAQFVADAGQERILEPVELAQPVGGVPDGAGVAAQFEVGGRVPGQ